MALSLCNVNFYASKKKDMDGTVVLKKRGLLSMAEDSQQEIRAV